MFIKSITMKAIKILTLILASMFLFTSTNAQHYTYESIMFEETDFKAVKPTLYLDNDQRIKEGWAYTGIGILVSIAGASLQSSAKTNSLQSSLGGTVLLTGLVLETIGVVKLINGYNYRARINQKETVLF